MTGATWFIWLIVAVVMLVAMWKIYVKAGKPGWASIVPIYNIIVWLEIVNRPIWWVLLTLIPFVNFVVVIILYLDTAKAFGKSAGFGVFSIFFPYVAFPILGFGDAQYVGAKKTEEPVQPVQQ
jgi:hypothetical protein